MRSGKKDIERAVAVALPRLQYRVIAPHNHHKNTILQTRTAKRWLSPSFGYERTRAPFQLQVLDRKNTIVGKYRGKAATATNKQFGTMAGVPHCKVLRNNRLRGSWQA